MKSQCQSSSCLHVSRSHIFCEKGQFLHFIQYLLKFQSNFFRSKYFFHLLWYRLLFQIFRFCIWGNSMNNFFDNFLYSFSPLILESCFSDVGASGSILYASIYFVLFSFLSFSFNLGDNSFYLPTYYF